jgi:hypothetical protein
MKIHLAHALLVSTAAFALAVAPLQAHAHCSNASAAGKWAYSYNGTLFTQNGALPAASVGHYKQDTSGNVTGSQTRSVAGDAAVEDIAGTIAMNPDCTAIGRSELQLPAPGKASRTFTDVCWNITESPETQVLRRLGIV